MKRIIELVRDRDRLTSDICDRIESITNGKVYVLYNESMPGIFKVGKTKRSAYHRASEISRDTGVPEKFKVLFEIKSAFYSDVELLAHEMLDKYRVSGNKEFFKCDPDAVLIAISNAIEKRYASYGFCISDAHKDLFEDLNVDILLAERQIFLLKSGELGTKKSRGFVL